jgi:hypothetical protein
MMPLRTHLKNSAYRPIIKAFNGTTNFAADSFKKKKHQRVQMAFNISGGPGYSVNNL